MAKHYNLDVLKQLDDLRSIWQNEARDFTPWLAREENIKLLSDAIGLEIAVTEVESPVGPFFVDIVGQEVGGDRVVVIVNQLESTDHDHLGKAITYAAGKDADIIIWCVKEAREEHIAAVEWANRKFNSEVAFFLCEIKLYQIGDSLPAVKFDVIEKPNEWLKLNNQNCAEQGNIKFEYWQAFIDYIKDNKEFTKEFSWKGCPAGYYFNLRIGKSYHLALLNNRKHGEMCVEIYIPDNKEMYRQLYKYKEEIETAVASSHATIEWMEMLDKAASRIVLKRYADTNDRALWPKQFSWAVEWALKMKELSIKYLQK